MDNYLEITMEQYQNFLKDTQITATKRLYAFLLEREDNQEIQEQDFFYNGGDWFDLLIWKYLLDSGFDYDHIGTIMTAALIRKLVNNNAMDGIPVQEIASINTRGQEQITKNIRRKFRYQTSSLPNNKVGYHVIGCEEDQKALLAILPGAIEPKLREARTNCLVQGPNRKDSSKYQYVFYQQCKEENNSSSKMIGEIAGEIIKSFQKSFYPLDADSFNLASILSEIIISLSKGMKSSSPYNNPNAPYRNQSRLLAREYFGSSK